MKKIERKHRLTRVLSIALIVLLALAVLPQSAAAGTLTPDSVSLTVDGNEIAVLSKTAERTGDDEWTVTLSVDVNESIAKSPLDICFCLDLSSSMTGVISSADSTVRLTALKNSMSDILDSLLATGATIRVSAVGFYGSVDNNYTSGKNLEWTTLSADTWNKAGNASINTYVKGLSTGSGTNTQAGLLRSYNMLTSSSYGANAGATKVLIFMGDGAASSSSYTPAYNFGTSGYVSPASFWAAGITTYSVALGCDAYSNGDMFVRTIAGSPKFNASTGERITSASDAAYVNTAGIGTTGIPTTYSFPPATS